MLLRIVKNSQRHYLLAARTLFSKATKDKRHNSRSMKGLLLAFCQLIDKRRFLSILRAFNLLKELQQKQQQRQLKGLEKLQTVEEIVKKKKTVTFDHILKVVFKDQASRIRLEKLAKVLGKIINKKLARRGLQGILMQGENSLKKDEILKTCVQRLIFAQL